MSSAGSTEPSRGTALVTGAARRIGRALALACAEAGYDVAAHHRGGPAVEETAESIRALGRRCLTPSAELTDPEALERLADEASAIGPVTLLVNSASLFEAGDFGSLTRTSWDAHLATNLSAPVSLAQAFARRLPADREGLVVNILDQRVWRPTPDFFAYGVSKGALWTATRMMAQALAPRIRVNAIGPGPTLPSIHQQPGEFEHEVQTTLLRHPSAPEDVAAALRYLIDARSVTGQMIAVDAGQHLSP